MSDCSEFQRFKFLNKIFDKINLKMYLIAVIVVLLAIYIYRYYASIKGFPPGPTPLPLVGNLHQLDLMHITETLGELSKTYGGIFRLNFPEPMVFITDYKLIKEALVKNAEAYAGRPQLVPPRMTAGGDYGIIFTEGPQWRDQRRFALHTLKNFGFGRNAMEEKILHSISTLLADFKKTANTDQPFDLADSVQLCVGDIISDVLMGHTFEHKRKRFDYLKSLIEQNFELIVSPRTRLLDLWTGFQYVPLINRLCNAVQLKDNFNQLFDFFKDEIDEHKRHQNFDNEPADFIEAYLLEWEIRRHKSDNSDEFFSIHQMVVALTDLWVAGMETSVTSLRWGFLYMAKYPEVQRKIREEIRQVLGADQQPTMADGQRLPYTSAAILEMQRCANIVPMNIFHKTTQDTELAGYKIKAGTAVIPNIANVMWNQELYPEPHEFKPERFLETVDGQLKVTNTDEVIPFSLGRRQCLGESLARMELFLIFVSVMQKFSLRSISTETLPEWNEYVIAVTRIPKHYNITVHSD